MSGKRAVGRIAGGILAVILFVVMGSYLFDFLQPYRLPGSDWSFYRKNFISSDGRVIDTGNENVSHSEGQGYGMLIAVAYEDRRTFDRLWIWTQKNLQTRPHDKLCSWLWKPDGKGGGAVADPNNASDGDLLIAWALVRASRRWKEYHYQQQATQILIDLARLDVHAGADGPYLLPGTEGFVHDHAITLNPSYYVFPALNDLGATFSGSPWAAVARNGEALIEKARFGRWNLVSDWVLTTDGKIQLAPNFPPLFGYNAVRVPLNIAWGNPHSPLLSSFVSFWGSMPSDKIPATVNLEDNAFGPYPALPGMKAIAAFTVASAKKGGLTVRALHGLTKGDSYFSASLTLLTKIAVRDCFGKK